MASDEHYLKNELYSLVKSDSSIFDFLQEGSLDGLWYWDLEKPEHEWMNPRFWSLLGYDPNERQHLAHEWQDLIFPEDLEIAIDNFNKHCADPRYPYDQVVRYRHKNGSTIWVRCRGLAIRNDKGKPVRMLGAHTDLTAQKQAEEDLKRKSRLFENFFHKTFQFALVLDTEGIVTEMSELCVKVCGSYAVNVIGNPLWDAGWWKQFPDVVEKTKNAVQRALKGQVASDEIRFVDQDNEIHHGIRTFTPITDTVGEIFQITVVGIDITERKRAEEAQKKSDIKYRQLVQTASDGIYFVSDSGKILDVNPSACSTLGRTREEILQLDINGIDPNFTVQEFLSFWKDIPHNEPCIFESTHQHKNGSLISVEVCGQKFRIDDETYYYGISRDITDRKIAERALSSSEKKWRNILVSTPQIGVTINAGAKITFVNDHFLKLTGWQEHDVIGQDWFEMFIPEQAREEIRSIFFEVMSRKDTAEFSIYENEILDKFGNLITVSWSNVLTKDVDENVVDVTCLGIDITERQKAEAALQKREAYMNSIFRAAPTGIGVVHDRIFRQVNDKFCEMLGYSKDELIGQQATIVYPSREEFERVGLEKYEQINEKGTGTVETVMQRKDGEVINVLLSSTPIDVSDLHAGVTFTALDITSRKQAEKALGDSHERFLTVLESIDATIYVADMENHEVLFMNRHMIDTFGRDMTGESCWKVFRGESMPCPDCNNDKLVDANNIPTDVLVWRGKNPITGKWYINYDRAIKWADGRLVRLQIATDISDILKMEAQLRQAQKMESVGRLAGGVAHDFNNMLSVILGNTEMILEDMDETNPVTHHLQEVKKAAERSANLTRQLLAFARKQTIAPKVIDLNETVDGMLKMLRSLIGEDIDFAWIPRINLWSIKIDPSQIDQILANLCVNARDSIKDVGKITIETDNVNFDKDYCHEHEGFIPGDYVMIAVSDNGCGMDNEILANLFEPFFTTKGVGEGTGLGLSTVYGIVKQNNGFINVYSEVDKGTSFKIYLPRSTETEVFKHENNAKKIAPKGTETILLVEDEEIILGMVRKILERLGYTVLTATSPYEAIRIVEEFKQSAIHLLITDVVMPEMNGLDLSNKLLTIDPNLKCLFMSGYTANVIVHHGVLEKGIQFIDKPFSKEDLAIKIRETLDDGKQTIQ